MNLQDLNEVLEANRERIRAWMTKKRSEVPIPIYGSVDVRDAGWKVGVVDANHFPAGFNNVSEENLSDLAKLFREHLQRTHPDCEWVHIYPESHTRNPGYVENIASIKSMIEQAGYRCTVGSPELNDFDDLHGLSGPLMLNRVDIDEHKGLSIEGKEPHLILLNNDLTEGAIPGLEAERHLGMGWHRGSQHYDAETLHQRNGRHARPRPLASHAGLVCLRKQVPD